MVDVCVVDAVLVNLVLLGRMVTPWSTILREHCVYRPIGLPDEEDKKALDKANRVYKSEGHNDQLDWMQE